MAVTLKDVAAAAGVSVQTVSNVVNGRSDHVGEQTRMAVLAAVETLRYRPNAAARHLRKAQVGVLAMAIPDLSNPYFSEIAQAVIRAAGARGYTVLIDHTSMDHEQEIHVANGLRPHLIDGVILDPQALNVADLLPHRGSVPIVLLGERIYDGPCDHVVIDNVAAAHLATAHLTGLGRRRIGVIGHKAHITSEAPSLRFHGYQDALTEAGIVVDPQLAPPVAYWWRPDGAQAMRALLALAQPPDAVFCFNDLMALGALHALHEAGRRVPDDVAVVGIDDIEAARYAWPPLTTIAPDKEAIGRHAVALLIGRLDGTRTGPPERIEPGFHLVVRGSTIGTHAIPLSSSHQDARATPV